MSEYRKAYMREYQREWIRKRRNDWIKQNGPCSWCGTWDNLEVDHIVPKDKLFNVSSLWSLSINNPKRINELAKCQVLCENCHVFKNSVDFKYENYTHGTYTCYTNGRCRCNECKEAVKLYWRAYRKRRK